MAEQSIVRFRVRYDRWIKEDTFFTALASIWSNI